MGNKADPKSSVSDPAAARNPRDLLILSASELHEILSPSLCLAALEGAYANLQACPDDRGRSIGFETAAGKFHVKAGLFPATRQYFAAKVNGNFPDNPQRFGAPTIQGLIVLCACDDGRPLAILQSGALTGLRTAAATALAAKHGARHDARSLAVIGCGAQARYQASAIADLLPIEALIVFDDNEESARAYRSWATRTLAVEARLSPTLEDAVRASDLCVTCTTAARPIIDARMVPPGCFVAAVGADNPDKQELDPQIFARARIIVDDLEQCAVSGDLAHAISSGVVRPETDHATLAQLAAGVKPGRVSDDEIVVFDSTGSGVQDVAVAATAYEAARERGIGRPCRLET